MKPSEEIMVQYKKKICEVAKAFDAFCTKYNLRYFGIGGTAIGALRHKGIIPWDDDIDFVMPRPDYERFLTLSSELMPKYDVFSHRSHPRFHLTMAKMCDANTSLLDSLRQHVVLGAFVDIFPMDGCPGKNAEERVVFFENYLKLRHKAEAIGNYYFFRDFLSAIYHKDLVGAGRQLLSHWYHILGRKNIFFEKCDRVLMANSFDASDYIAYFATWRGCKVISPRMWFEGYEYVPFEDFQIRVPKGINQYLKQVYGDYMVPPPPEKRIAQHSFGYLNLERRVSWEEANRL